MDRPDWRTVVHEATGISCEIGRLTWRQQPVVAAMVAEALYPVQDSLDTKSGPGTVVQSFVALRNAVEKLDDAILQPIFETKVRNVRGLKADDAPADGLALLADAPNIGCMVWLLSELVRDGQLSEEQGKASGSPSTSPSEANAASASAAESTASADGPSPSIVGGTPTGSESSSRVA